MDENNYELKINIIIFPNLVMLFVLQDYCRITESCVESSLRISNRSCQLFHLHSVNVSVVCEKRWRDINSLRNGFFAVSYEHLFVSLS